MSLCAPVSTLTTKHILLTVIVNYCISIEQPFFILIKVILVCKSKPSIDLACNSHAVKYQTIHCWRALYSIYAQGVKHSNKDSATPASVWQCFEVWKHTCWRPSWWTYSPFLSMLPQPHPLPISTMLWISTLVTTHF